MIKVRLYEDGDRLKVKDPVEPFSNLGGILDKEAKRGVAATALEDGEIMACGGVLLLNENEGLVWIKMDKKCSERPFVWARLIKEVFGIMCDCLGKVKISAYILDNFCKGEKLAKLINLKFSNRTVEHKNNIYKVYSMVS